MRFEWDPRKARANFTKHRITFEAAQRVWNDPLHLTYLDRVVDGEQRWHALGQVGAVTLLLVVHIYVNEDDERIRIIGARKATPAERRDYEEQAL